MREAYLPEDPIPDNDSPNVMTYQNSQRNAWSIISGDPSAVYQRCYQRNNQQKISADPPSVKMVLKMEIFKYMSGAEGQMGVLIWQQKAV